MEDEYHFLNIWPAYQDKRSSLLDYLENEYGIKISRMSPNRIFMLLINPPSGNVRIQKLIAKHIFYPFNSHFVTFYVHSVVTSIISIFSYLKIQLATLCTIIN